MSKKHLPLLFLLFAFNFSAKAQTLFPNMDVQHYTFNLTLNDANDVIKGKAAITIKLLKNVRQVELNLVKKNDGGKGMLVSAITENGKSLKFSQDEDVLHITTSAQNNSIHTYTINYSGVPADGLIISTNKFGHRTFFGDNWPDRAHNWLPCADYLSDKATVDFVVTAPDHYKVVSNGLKIEEKELPGRNKLTHWKESAKLAPDVMVIGVADFAIGQSGTVKGIPVYSYVFPENKESGFKSYAYAPAVLSYYYNKIGPYAFEKLANVQSKTIYGGMENSSAIFYFEDSPGDAGAESLIAHEVAHQWFGDNVTEKTWKDLWLSEGFATYMTNCYLENKYGADTLKQRMVFDRQKVINFEKERFTPVIDSNVTGDYKQLLNANSYEKGSWTLHMLRRKLGDTLFWKGLRIYYAKKGGGNASTADLETTMEQTSGQSLHRFFHQWLKIAGTPRLSISWNYDADKKLVNIHITQKQEYLYDLPVQYAIGNKIYTIEISDKETVLSLPVAVKPTGIKMDPNVNLLASFEVVEL